MSRVRVVVLWTAWCCVFSSGYVAADQPLDGDQLLRSAQERIERHRMNGAVVTVVDAAGDPVSDVKMSVDMTRHEFLFGCNIFMWGRQRDPSQREAYKHQFDELLNFATYGYYWPSYEREQGKPRHADASEVVAWCDEWRIMVKGHPLAWNYSDPRWLPDDSDEIYRLQMQRIDDCVREFRGRIDCWDVVNEVTHYDRDGMKKDAPKMTGMWQKYGQMEFTKACFEKARAANPGATLLINDYRNDVGYERVVEQLVDKTGKPLYDVIGLQSHMHGGAWSNEKLWNVCQRFSRFDVPLHFTELTILSGKPKLNNKAPDDWSSTPEGEKRQADDVERVYTMLFSHPAVEAITWWDFSDQGAWQGAPAGLINKDCTPKPAYDRLLRLVRDKWWTNVSGKTDAAGQFALRGYRGDYDVTVTMPSGRTVKQAMTLKKGDNANRFELKLAE